MTQKERDRPPMRDARADIWQTEYVYRRHLSASELLPAVAAGAVVGLAAFYLARILLARTTLRPEGRPRSARLPDARAEPR